MQTAADDRIFAHDRDDLFVYHVHAYGSVINSNKQTKQHLNYPSLFYAGLLPLRWLPVESLRDGIYVTASDVWWAKGVFKIERISIH